MEVLIICLLAFFRLNNAENIFCFESNDRGLDGKEVEVCDQPILHGPTRYGYDKYSRSCESFVAGCKTNSNNFASLAECQNNCVKGPPPDEDEYDRLDLTPIKWCGPGNISKNYDDLGYFKEADKCCRAHDNCPDYIEKGGSKYNLINHASYTRLSCECDEQFRQCLHKANTMMATTVGNFYFDGLGTECYRQEYPIKGCKKKGGWYKQKCIKYEYDTTLPKIYQWFSVPGYSDVKKKKLRENVRMPRYQHNKMAAYRNEKKFRTYVRLPQYRHTDRYGYWMRVF